MKTNWLNRNLLMFALLAGGAIQGFSPDFDIKTMPEKNILDNERNKVNFWVFLGDPESSMAIFAMCLSERKRTIVG